MAMSQAASTMSILDLLRDDHRRVEALFEEFEKAETPGQRQRIAHQALMELKIHSTLEEELFYPAVRKKSEAEEAEDMVGEAMEEHHLVDLLMEELQTMRGSDRRFKSKFTVLSEAVQHHVEEEEKEMFPAAESAGIDLERMGKRAQQRKEELQAAGERRVARQAGRKRGRSSQRAGGSRTSRSKRQQRTRRAA